MKTTSMFCSIQAFSYTLVLLNYLLQRVNGEVFSDDFFIKTTPAPTRFSSSRPSISQHPTPAPSYSPSELPTSHPSNKPSYTIQQFQYSFEIEFDELQDALDERSEKVLENETNKLMKKHLDQNVDDFHVDAQVIRTKIISKQDQVMQGLTVMMNMDISVRSETSFTDIILIGRMKSALDENDERESFILNLQYSDDNFAPVNSITKFTINDEEIELANEDKRGGFSLMQVAIGIAIGIIIAFLIALFVCKRMREKSVSNLDKAAYSYPPKQFPIEFS